MIQGHLNNKNKCPKCVSLVDCFTSIGHNESPEPGSISICAYCGNLNQYDKDLKLKELSKDEFAELDADTKKLLLKAVAIINFRNQHRMLNN